MRIVVTGKTGQIAQSLIERAPSHGATVIAIGRPEFDLADANPAVIETLLSDAQPDVIISAAAYTAVDKAESEPAIAHAVNARGPQILCQAAAALGIPVLHISTDYVFDGHATEPYAEDGFAAPRSAYGRTKTAGEQAVLAAVPSATILRPSVVFGPEDQFTNRFAALARMSPFLPLIGGGMTRMQPVYVGDVAAAVADAVDGKTKLGATYELGGPEVLTMREIMEVILAITERKRMLVSLPWGLARLQAFFLQFAPGAFKLTPDQVAMLQSDNVVSDAAKAAGLTLEGLGITPDSMEAVAPQYLWRFRAAGQFQRKSA